MTTVNYYCTSDDMWGAGGAIRTSNYLALGTTTYGHDYVWIPFTIDLPQGISIISAKLKLTASGAASDSVNVDIGCDDQDNPSTPSDYTDLSTRSMTSSVLTTGLATWVVDTVYSHTITGSVQEIFNRAGWTNNNTLAVYITSNTVDTNNRGAYSYDGDAGKRAFLEIVFPSFIPSGSML